MASERIQGMELKLSSGRQKVITKQWKKKWWMASSDGLSDPWRVMVFSVLLLALFVIYMLYGTAIEERRAVVCREPPHLALLVFQPHILYEPTCHSLSPLSLSLFLSFSHSHSMYGWRCAVGLSTPIRRSLRMNLYSAKRGRWIKPSQLYIYIYKCI